MKAEIWGIYCTFIDRFSLAAAAWAQHKILCFMAVDVPSSGLIAALNNHQNQLTIEQTQRKDEELRHTNRFFSLVRSRIYADAPTSSKSQSKTVCR